ncbi:lactonase family protein [Algibacter sp. PT7-4]|uniref:lactonase family protein n=1 Tax=Algibacter ulvanivorans TaxID=3400999 RepID=UPI003AADB70A
MIKKVLVLLIIMANLSCKKNTTTTTTTTLLFIGSFTNKEPGAGIHVFAFNNETGKSTLKYTVDNVTNTSFIKLSPKGKYLYSVVESQMKHHGKVAAFKIDSINHKLNFINQQDCGGRNPVHIEVDKTGTLLLNSNYTDASLSIFNINKDGSLNPYSQLLKFKDSSIIASRQKEAHIHSSNTSPDNQYVFAQDLGADKIRGFKMGLDNKKKILQNEIQNKMRPGSGPRHFTFHPNGKFGYSIAELSGKVTVFKYINGQLKFVEDYQSYKQNQDIYRAADIHISPDGKFLYASNRGPKEDSISIFSINLKNGKLELVGHEPTYGKHPRNFVISPDGKFLLVANLHSNNIIVFRRNMITGKLYKLPQEITVNSPSSLQIKAYKF